MTLEELQAIIETLKTIEIMKAHEKIEQLIQSLNQALDGLRNQATLKQEQQAQVQPIHVRTNQTDKKVMW
jgi:hypothetical protein